MKLNRTGGEELAIVLSNTMTAAIPVTRFGKKVLAHSANSIRQVRLLCPLARHLTGRPTFMWKTGDPDNSEIATPKRVRTFRPKHGDTIRFLVNGG